MSLTLSSPRVVIVTVMIALAGLALAGGTVVLILPQMSDANSLQQKIAAAEARLASASAAAAAAAAPSATNSPAQAAASELFQLSAAMPETTDMPGILMQLSALAAESSVKISAIQPSPLVAGASGYSTLPFSLALSGKYAAITRFLALLREAVSDTSAGLAVHGRLFVVNGIQLAPGAGTASGPAGSSAGGTSTVSPGTLGATLQVDAFVYGTTPPQTTSTSTTTTSG